LFDLIDRGLLKGTSYSDKEYVGLESVPAALKALGSRDTWGKVVADIPQSDGKSRI